MPEQNSEPLKLIKYGVSKRSDRHTHFLNFTFAYPNGKTQTSKLSLFIDLTDVEVAKQFDLPNFRQKLENKFIQNSQLYPFDEFIANLRKFIIDYEKGQGFIVSTDQTALLKGDGLKIENIRIEERNNNKSIRYQILLDYKVTHNPSIAIRHLMTGAQESELTKELKSCANIIDTDTVVEIDSLFQGILRDFAEFHKLELKPRTKFKGRERPLEIPLEVTKIGAFNVFGPYFTIREGLPIRCYFSIGTGDKENEHFCKITRSLGIKKPDLTDERAVKEASRRVRSVRAMILKELRNLVKASYPDPEIHISTTKADRHYELTNPNDIKNFDVLTDKIPVFEAFEVKRIPQKY